MKKVTIEVPDEKNPIMDIYLNFCIRDCIERGEIPCIFSEQIEYIDWVGLYDMTAFYTDIDFPYEMKRKKDMILSSNLYHYDIRFLSKKLWEEFQVVISSLGFDKPERIEKICL
jgi:hypothetical protein